VANRLMLVPGTGGVRFKLRDSSGNETDAPYLVEMFEGHLLASDDKFYRALACEHDPVPASPPADYDYRPKSSTLEKGMTLEPGMVLQGTAYQAVHSFGVDRQNPAQYYPFTYDWRLDLRYNATKLLTLLKNSGDQWRILCHSQGGLVVMAASRLAGAATWAKLASRVCFVAIPFVGTINAIQAIVTGNTFGQWTSEVFRKTARTWPALYQMFPQYFCVTNRPSASILDSAFWPALGDGGVELVKRAQSFWREIDFAHFANMDPNSVAIMLGKPESPNTPVYVSADGLGLPEVSTQLDIGDTLVPWSPTAGFLQWSGLAPRLLPITGALQKDHAYLLNDAAVFARAHEFLTTGQVK
jgi:hypothetical protein